jgi:hypothetical protein
VGRENKKNELKDIIKDTEKMSKSEGKGRKEEE